MAKDKVLKHWRFQQEKKKKEKEQEQQAMDEFIKQMDKIWGLRLKEKKNERMDCKRQEW